MCARFKPPRVRILTPAGHGLFRLVVSVGLAFVAQVSSLGESPSSRVIADSFDNAESGRPPAPWVPMSGAESDWAVLPDLTAPTPPKILANIWVGAENGVRSILVQTERIFADGGISVRLKPMGGLRRESAGAIWRYRAPDEYEFARLDFAASTVAVCVVNGGAPNCVERRAELDGTSWSTLSVNFRGRHVSLALDGRSVFETDTQHDVWPGKPGLWSAASSVTFFDDFKAIETVSK
jgi:hypothetical protein